MATDEVMKYSQIRDSIESLAKDNGLTLNYGSENQIYFKKMPESMEEARAYSNFWNAVVDKFKDEIGEISFAYQENDKELPLSFGKKALKSIGLKVKPKIEEGEIKYDGVTPELIMGIRGGLVNLVANRDEWERLNEIYIEGVKGFSAPHVCSIGNLCDRVNIPFETINAVRFKPQSLNGNSVEGAQ